MNALVIDDNKIARTTIRHLAGKAGDIDIVAECADAKNAYELLQSTPVDLLLLDIEMPGMSGLELVQNLGRKGPSLFLSPPKESTRRMHSI
jgi:CheY-like chemotaxis protein